MNHFYGDLEKLKFLKYDVTAIPYYLVNNGEVLVIGVGTGRDILTGLVFDQKSITGVEFNEDILYVLNDLLGDFSGRLTQNQKVRFVNDEARSYLFSSEQNFDLIQISLIDTFAASLAGAYTLTENSLYTVEAFTVYLEHLKDNGFLSVSYWYHKNKPENILKLTGLATRALQKLGIDNTRDHIVIVHKEGESGVATLLVKKTEFSTNELLEIDKISKEMGFKVILSSQTSKDEAFAKMSDVKEITNFYKQYKRNIAPPTDDSPFFFLFNKIYSKDFFKFNNFAKFRAESILFSLLVLMSVLTAAFILIPLIKSSGFTSTPNNLFLYSVYFSSIGLAFMFIEISQMTRLSIFLGHPIYSLAIVLFALLVSSGIGSYFLGGIENPKKSTILFMIFILVCSVFLFLTKPALHYFSKYNIFIRLITSVAIIAPLGFFMGSFLPQGIRLVDRVKGPVPLFWGLNGAASVIGSILAMIFMITNGIRLTFLTGIILYVIAIVVFATLFVKHKKPSAPDW